MNAAFNWLHAVIAQDKLLAASATLAAAVFNKLEHYAYGRFICVVSAATLLSFANFAQAEFELEDDRSNVRLFTGATYDNSTYVEAEGDRFDTNGIFFKTGLQLFLKEEGLNYLLDGDYEIYQTETRGSDTTNMIESGFVNAEVFTDNELAGWFVNYDAQALIFDNSFGSIPENRSVRTSVSTGPQSLWRISPRDTVQLRGIYTKTDSSISVIESESINAQASYSHAFTRFTQGSLSYSRGIIRPRRFIVDEFDEERSTARVTRRLRFGEVYAEGGFTRMFNINSREAVNDRNEFDRPSWGVGFDVSGVLGALSISAFSDLTTSADSNQFGSGGSDFPTIQRGGSFLSQVNIKNPNDPRFLIPRFSIEETTTALINFRSRQKQESASPKLQRIGWNLSASYNIVDDLIRDVPDRDLLFLTAGYGRPIRSAWLANAEIQRIVGDGRDARTGEVFEIAQTFYTLELLYEVNSKFDMIGSLEYRQFSFPSDDAESDGYLFGLELSYRIF